MTFVTRRKARIAAILFTSFFFICLWGLLSYIAKATIIEPLYEQQMRQFEAQVTASLLLKLQQLDGNTEQSHHAMHNNLHDQHEICSSNLHEQLNTISQNLADKFNLSIHPHIKELDEQVEFWVALKQPNGELKWLKLLSEKPYAFGYRLYLLLGVVCMLLAVVSIMLASWFSFPLNHLTTKLKQAAHHQFGDDEVVLSRHHVLKPVELYANRLITKLREIEKQKKALLSALSHDLRTPITRIRLHLDLMHADKNVEVAGIQNELIYIDSIITKFLEYSQVSISTSQQQHDLSRSIQEYITHKYPNTSKQIILHKQSNVLAFLCTDLLNYAVSHLVDNALTFATSTVTITIDHHSDSQVMISIEDDGSGIPEEQLESVFEPMMKADKARTEAGCGLGLTIAYQAILALKGELTLTNQPQSGLKSTIILPKGP